MLAERNADPAEIARFSAHADSWWDTTGPLATLHAINPLRVDWIDSRSGGLRDRRVVDVGCGGGILTEAMCIRGADVSGIDASEDAIEAARAHAIQSGLEIEYRTTTAEEMAETGPAEFDIVVCMEMLEHIPDPESAIAALARMVRPGGHVFVSTLNRSPRAFAEAILAAEYLLRLLPAGTHEYARFIRPSELAGALRRAGLEVNALKGLTYSPITRSYRLTDSVAVNYLIHARRPAPT
jgi:2-polyprenyl-6-hydroxyphenyl methylase/3-demethylubiquinone-9 3-methyltransferase